MRFTVSFTMAAVSVLIASSSTALPLNRGSLAPHAALSQRSLGQTELLELGLLPRVRAI
jgi:hypothetical protein